MSNHERLQIYSFTSYSKTYSEDPGGPAERQCSILESKINALPSKTNELRKTQERSTATEAVTWNVKNALQLADMTADGQLNALTKQNKIK